MMTKVWKLTSDNTFVLAFFLYMQTNTYQAIVITDGEQSYAIFTYLCGAMNWHGYATIGINSDGNFYTNYPLSGTSSVTEVACLEYPDSLLKNLIYPLTSHTGSL